MRTCWASALGDCGGGISGEHVLSACVFDGPEIKVSGRPWSAEIEKTIPLKRFVANTLCRDHNSRLSFVDAAGSRALDAIAEFERIGRVRASMMRRTWNVSRHVVNGYDLERWLVKSAINVFCVSGGGRKWHATRTPPGEPPRCLIDYVFGTAPLPFPMGLSFAVRVGQTLHRNDGFETCAFFDEQHDLMAWRLIHQGFYMVLWLCHESPAVKLPDDARVDEAVRGSDLMFHVREVYRPRNRWLSEVLELVW